MARRRSGNSHTTISITWKDKDELRRYARELKTTKNGKLYESDAELFSRILEYYKNNSDARKKEEPVPTYPNKTSLDVSQPDSSHEEAK